MKAKVFTIGKNRMHIVNLGLNLPGVQSPCIGEISVQLRFNPPHFIQMTYGKPPGDNTKPIQLTYTLRVSARREKRSASTTATLPAVAKDLTSHSLECGRLGGDSGSDTALRGSDTAGSDTDRDTASRASHSRAAHPKWERESFGILPYSFRGTKEERIVLRGEVKRS